MTGEVELLSRGSEPSPRRASGGVRAARGLALCLIVAVAGALCWHSTREPTSAAAPAPAPPAGQLASSPGQVRVSTTEQRALVTGQGRVDLVLELVNDGDLPVELVGARLPQPGVRPAAGSGGLAPAPTLALLLPGTPTVVTVHLALACPQVLAGQAPDHLELTLDDRAGDARVAALDLRSLPGFWDRVRRSACDPHGSSDGTLGGVSADAAPQVVTAVPTSVRWEGGTTDG